MDSWKETFRELYKAGNVDDLELFVEGLIDGEQLRLLAYKRQLIRGLKTIRSAINSPNNEPQTTK